MKAYLLALVFLKFGVHHQFDVPYLICMGSALMGLLCTHVQRNNANRLLKLVAGPVPGINECKALREFHHNEYALRSSIGSNGISAVMFSLLSLFILVMVEHLSNSTSAHFTLASILALSVLNYIFGARRKRAKSDLLKETRPEFNAFKYMPLLKEDSETCSDEKLFWGNLDDFTYAFHVKKFAATNESNTPLEAAEAHGLSNALWKANHEENPSAGDLVLLLFHDGKSHFVKTLVTKVAMVEYLDDEALLTTPGKTIITAAGQKFCGGTVAHFCGERNEKIAQGWLTTADRAHILLSSLRWLTDDQREYCYQLINAGKKYPNNSELAQA